MNVRPKSLFRARQRQRHWRAHRAAQPAELRDATPELEDLPDLEHLRPSAEELARLRNNLPRLDADSLAFLLNVLQAGPEATMVLLMMLLARSRGIERLAADDLDASYVVNLDVLPPGLLGIWEGRQP
jgi:hypothetical protein